MQQKQPNPWIRYGNLAIQMGVIIGLFTWAGIRMDDKFRNNTPVYTIVLSLVGIGASLYLVFRDLLKQNK